MEPEEESDFELETDSERDSFWDSLLELDKLVEPDTEILCDADKLEDPDLETEALFEREAEIDEDSDTEVDPDSLRESVSELDAKDSEAESDKESCNESELDVLWSLDSDSET